MTKAEKVLKKVLARWWNVSAGGGHFVCEKCRECFSRLVWHCSKCDHHWPPQRADCWNCHDNRRPTKKTHDQFWWALPSLGCPTPWAHPPGTPEHDPKAWARKQRQEAEEVLAQRGGLPYRLTDWLRKA